VLRSLPLSKYRKLHLLNYSGVMILVTTNHLCLRAGRHSVEVGLLECWSVTVRLCDAIEIVDFEEMSSLLVY
jgi:hypothetical protein